MKLTSLLIQFLYTNERLDLPGIGSFTLDRNIIAGFDNPKNRQPITEGISFVSKPSLTDSPELIRYISETTGKMKSLATADLESRLELAKQFLNLGKPFTFEGLGTLVRRPTGEVEFTQAFVVPDPNRPILASTGFQERQEVVKKHESVFSEQRKTGTVSRPIMAALVIGGIILAVGAGYWISRPAGKSEVTAAVNNAIPTTDTPEIIASDSSAAVTPATTAVTETTATAAPAASRVVTADGSYKYVLEVAKSTRAFKRYNQLRTNLWNVELETKDSVDYKLILMLPKMNADTTRVLDSLTVMLGRKVYIEPQN
ncbi:MAG: hypothetical protein EOO09_04260 [Chitinophagaceae bacterium]|nr:MAG: hypothetical protein EOO09_04260 [Chitinophagaceae bacterium]